MAFVLFCFLETVDVKVAMSYFDVNYITLLFYKLFICDTDQ